MAHMVNEFTTAVCRKDAWREPPLDAEEWEGKSGKEAFFSPKPGQGD